MSFFKLGNSETQKLILTEILNLKFSAKSADGVGHNNNKK